MKTTIHFSEVKTVIVGNYLKTDVVDFTDNGKCSQCGSCCTALLPMTDGEIRRLKAYVRKNNIRPRRKNFVVNKTIDLTCPFRDEAERKCLVYKARPEICRQFICNEEQREIFRKENSEYTVANLRVIFGEGN